MKLKSELSESLLQFGPEPPRVPVLLEADQEVVGVLPVRAAGRVSVNSVGRLPPWSAASTLPSVSPRLRTLPAGAFDDPAWIAAERQPFRHVFVRSRRAWSELSPLVETYEQHFRP